MSKFTPHEPGAPDGFNPHRITHEEMVGLRDQIAAEEAGVIESEDTRFANMFDPNFEMKSPEDAAVRGPLTAEDIARKRGGEYPTQARVDGINTARAVGKHLH